MEPTHAPVNSRRWLWYAATLLLVAVVLLFFLFLFVQQQLEPGRQLKREQLAAARTLWNDKKITDYQMLYTVQRGGDRNRDRFYVDVKGGKVRSVVLNGRDKVRDDQLEDHSMVGLYRDIERFLMIDEKAGAPQTFCRGYFDTDDGHLVQFNRQVLGGPERVEIRVEEFKPTPAN